MKVLIVDDEPLARTRIRSIIEKLSGYEVIGEVSNGMEALKAAEHNLPDVVLMDIRMPGMDGLEAAQHLSRLDMPPSVIFTTAYAQHAIQAFDVHAVGYLLKPVREEALDEALRKAQIVTRAQITSLSEEPEMPKGRTHLCVRMRGNLELVPVDEIIFFQADHKYVTVRYRGGEVIIEDSLKSLEDEFGDRFVRVHRNALIASNALIGIEKDGDGPMLAVINGAEEKLEISRRHVADIRRYLKSR